MANGRPDPYKNFRFQIELGGTIMGWFTECSGLSSKVATIEYREGGNPKTVYKLPGQTSYTDITLKWGLSDSTYMYEWHSKAFEGAVERRSGSIIILGDDGAEVARWNFTDAWPTTWNGPALNAKSNEVAIETMVLTCEKIERTK